MYTSRLQGMLGNLASKFRRTAAPSEPQNQGIEDLAEQIVEYGRMIRREYPHQKLLVNITEVARRFREDRQRVLKALVLLRTQGRADHTARGEDWRLHV